MLKNSQSTKISQKSETSPSCDSALKFKKLKSLQFIKTADRIVNIIRSSKSGRPSLDSSESPSPTSSNNIFEGGSSEGKEDETRA